MAADSPRSPDSSRTPGSPRTLGRREALRITAVVGAAVGLGGSLVVGALRRAGLHRLSETRTRMGTAVTITVVHPEPAAARQMVSSAFVEMNRLEDLLSRHREGTPVFRLNATGSLRDAPEELIEVLAWAGRYSAASAGAFDVTVLPILDLYSRRFAAGPQPPSDEEVRAALKLVDYRGVHVSGRHVALADPRMAITLDGIAKGYVVDRTVDVLTAAGADRVLVNAGGDMASAGTGSIEDPWLVSVQDPADAGRYVDLVRLAGESIATSGDYMRTFTEDRSFHHIVDPRSGYSPAHTSSVSVVAPTAADADALSTAVLVLGPVEGLALLERSDRVEGVIVTKSGERIRTSGMGGHSLSA